MKAYSIDLRERVLVDCDAGMEVRQVAVKYRVSESWIRRLRQRRRESGEVAPRKSDHPAEPKWLAHRERLEALVHESRNRPWPSDRLLPRHPRRSTIGGVQRHPPFDPLANTDRAPRPRIARRPIPASRPHWLGGVQVPVAKSRSWKAPIAI